MGESLTKTPLVGMILSQAQLKNFPPIKETSLPASLLLVILFSVLPGLTLGHGVLRETLAFCSKERVSIFGPTSIWALNIWSLAMTIFFF